MWRTLRLACVNYPDAERMKLERVAGRLGLQERFDSFSEDNGLPATLESYDVVFLSQARGDGANFRAVRILRAASRDAVFILHGERLGFDDISVALNVARIDWVLPRDFSDKELKEALTWAVSELEIRRHRRELQFGHDILKATRTPAAILDRNYRIVYANPNADVLFALQDPFRITSAGQLVCMSSDATAEFHVGLSRSLHKHFRDRENAFLRVDRADGRRAVVVVSIPQCELTDDQFTYHLVLNDLESRELATAEDVATALRISMAEARLTRSLACGCDLDEACAALNISVNTARGYLKSIFEKTGVTRQAELVRLALLALH